MHVCLFGSGLCLWLRHVLQWTCDLLQKMGGGGLESCRATFRVAKGQINNMSLVYPHWRQDRGQQTSNSGQLLCE